MEDSEKYGEQTAKDPKTGKFLPGNQFGTKRGENKVSTKAKETIIDFIENNVEKIQESFDKLKPAEKLKFISDILPYAIPKLSSVQSDIKVEGMQSAPSIQIYNQAPPMASSEDKIDV